MRASVKAIVVAGLCATLTACSSVRHSDSEQSATPQPEPGPVVAIQFSTHSYDGVHQGALVLAKQTGELVETFKIGEMDPGYPVWGAQGLIFADSQHWYRYTDQLETHDAELPLASQYGPGLEGTDGHIELVFYKGSTETGQASHRLSVDSSGNGYVHEIPGSIGAYGMCPEGAVFMAGSDSRITNLPAQDDKEGRAEALYTVAADKEVQILGKRPGGTNHDFLRNAAPCTSQGLHILEPGLAGGGKTHVFTWKWDGEMGERIAVNHLSEWENSGSMVFPELMDGNIRRCNAYGLCMDVDPSTGKAAISAQKIFDKWEVWPAWTSHKGKTYMLTVPANRDGDGHLWVLDPTTTAWNKILTIPNLGYSRDGDNNMVMTGFALNPEWEPPAVISETTPQTESTTQVVDDNPTSVTPSSDPSETPQSEVSTPQTTASTQTDSEK